MNTLLDTQALLWFLLDDPRLSRKAMEIIVDAEGLTFVSPASLWEIAIKISLGKYALPTPFAAFWDEQLKGNDFTLLPIAVSHAARVVELPFHPRSVRPLDHCPSTGRERSNDQQRYAFRSVWRGSDMVRS